MVTKLEKKAGKKFIKIRGVTGMKGKRSNSEIKGNPTKLKEILSNN